MDSTGLAIIADVLTGLSLVAVVIIGYKTFGVTKEATTATKETSEATKKATDATEQATEATAQSVMATERAVAATELATKLAEQDARTRRIEGLLDVLLEMRELFNAQHRIDGNVPPYNSPEAFARLALMRKLEGRLVLFEARMDELSNAQVLTTTYNWGSGFLEAAIEEAKSMLRAEGLSVTPASAGEEGGHS